MPPLQTQEYFSLASDWSLSRRFTPVARLVAYARALPERVNAGWIGVISLILTVISLLLTLYSDFPRAFLILCYTLAAFGVAGIITSVLLVASVQRRLRRYQECLKTIHFINHEYRNSLGEVFGNSKACLDDRERSRKEVETIAKICSLAARAYSSLILERCIITVKLIDRRNDTVVCKTYARSEHCPDRDIDEYAEFRVSGENTAFAAALVVDPDRGISRFYGDDLPKLENKGHYKNQRRDYARFYKSAIVVPIRYINYADKASLDHPDNVGFLSVDTMVTYLLNDDDHVAFLAALADQMYNYLSLMRGTYTLPETGSRDMTPSTQPSTQPPSKGAPS